MLADTITSGMMGSFVYLFVLNALIGVLEGKLLQRWFSGSRHSVRWMIAANYLSAWVGWFGLRWLIEPRMDALLGPRPIERINLLAVAWILLSFAISVFVEAGFVHLAIDRAKRSPARALFASFCVNAVSYLFVASWFVYACYTLPLNARVTTLSNLGPLPRANLFWVDSVGQIWRQALDQSRPPRVVGRAVSTDSVSPVHLQIDPDATHVQIRAMYSFRGAVGAPPPEAPLVQDAGPVDGFPSDYWDRSPFDRKAAIDLRPRGQRATRVDFDWYRSYLRTNVPRGPSANLYVGFSALDWGIQDPTVLADDKVVFEMGGQILIFDPRTKKLAFLTLGTCPAVVPNAE